jgi:hypothetical protein
MRAPKQPFNDRAKLRPIPEDTSAAWAEDGMNPRGQIEQGGARLPELHKLIHRTLPKRNDEWRNACAEFHRSYDAPSIPGGLDQRLKELKVGESEAVELAVTLLEVDAMFFRSGYIKEELIQRLKNIKLSAEHRERLSRAILNVVDNRDCREFRRYGRLASRVRTQELIHELQARKTGGNEDVARRATWVLEAIEAAESITERRR